MESWQLVFFVKLVYEVAGVNISTVLQIISAKQ